MVVFAVIAEIPTFWTVYTVVATHPKTSLNVIFVVPPDTCVMVAKALLVVLDVAAMVAIPTELDTQGLVAKGAAFAVMVNVEAGLVFTPHKYVFPEELVNTGIGLEIKLTVLIQPLLFL